MNDEVRDRLIECFRGDQLRTYTAAEVRAMGLTARTADLLTEVGLPRRRGAYLAATNLVPLALRGSRPAAVHKGSLVRVGVCNEATFALDVVSDALWFVAPEPPGKRRRRVPVRFVNAHLDVYLECLCRARPALDRQPDEWTGEDRLAALAALRQDLESIDGEAFDDPDSYWSVIFRNLTAEPAPPDFMHESSLIGCFGHENLRTFTVDEVEAAGVPDRLAPLLTTVGMPRDLEPYVVATDLTVLDLHGSPLHSLHPEGFTRVGRREQTDVAVDRRTGEVWLVDRDIREPCFVNTDLRTYLACVCHVWRALDEGTPGFPLPAARGLVARLRQEVCMMDERALAHEMTYWSVVFEELGYEVS